jgi:hypothetical protein
VLPFLDLLDQMIDPAAFKAMIRVALRRGNVIQMELVHFQMELVHFSECRQKEMEVQS